MITANHIVPLNRQQPTTANLPIQLAMEPVSDGINEYIYWFPAEMVVDPFTGAVEYVPVT
jgi:hypothetical protein